MLWLALSLRDCAGSGSVGVRCLFDFRVRGLEQENFSLDKEIDILSSSGCQN